MTRRTGFGFNILALCCTLIGVQPVFAEDEEYSLEELEEYAADYGISMALLTFEGDPDYGAYLGGECTTCHQSTGDSNGIPPIVYLDDVFFKIAMHEYKTKQRENPVMQLIAGRLSDEEIAALAAYFTSLDVE